MERPLSEIYEKLMYELPTKGRGTRHNVQRGFTSIDTTGRTLDFLPFDPVMSIVNTFSEHGERLSNDVGYGGLIVRVKNRSGIWDVNEPTERVSDRENLLRQAREKAAEHLTLALARSRGTPLFVVTQTINTRKLLAAQLRAFTPTERGIIPIVSDVNEMQGRIPRGVVLAPKPLATRRLR